MKVLGATPLWLDFVGRCRFGELNELIAQKPDVLIFHPLEMQAYAKLVKKAMVTGLRPNQSYTMRVEAMAADGSAAGLSNVVQFRTRR